LDLAWHSKFSRLQGTDKQHLALLFDKESTMVRLNKQAKIPGGIGGFVAISVGTLLVLGMLFSSQNVVTVAPLSMMTTFDAESNGSQLKAWRQNLRDLCTAATSADDVKAIEAQQISGFALPVDPPPQPRGDAAIQLCKRILLDFGANIGDTSGHAIDVGLVSCNRNEDLKAFTPPSHFNVQTKEFEVVKKRNILTANMAKLFEMQATNQNTPNLVGPEDYCYYGVEGNPHFTQRLRGIEDSVMAIRPRPIQHMHFFTESVGAGQDGMTKLYLDTVNDKQNFWGSSIYKGHQDVRKSVGEGNDAETVAAPVMGYTIGTLMRKTLKAFDPSATAEEKKGGHLILKVDIEGGE
jgi:hypothetical protein